MLTTNQTALRQAYRQHLLGLAVECVNAAVAMEADGLACPDPSGDLHSRMEHLNSLAGAFHAPANKPCEPPRAPAPAACLPAHLAGCSPAHCEPQCRANPRGMKL